MSAICGLCNQEFDYADVDFHLNGKCSESVDIKVDCDCWQCQSCKGIMVTVPIARDFICNLCKNPRLRNLVATGEDFTQWLAGNRYNNGRYLLDYCVCLQYPTNCRFHTDRMVTDGPHNLWPPFPK